MEINIMDFEKSASKLLDSAVYNFFRGGAADEITVKENEESYSKLKLIPRVLRGVNNPDTSVSCLGQLLDMPILIAPMAFQKLCHPNGELETACGVKQAKTLMTISTYSMTPLQQIISTLSIAPWFQLYILKDRGLTKSIIEFIEHQGCAALVITVDAPTYGKREREIKDPLEMDIVLPDLFMIGKKLSLNFELNNAKQLSAFLDNSISWDDIAWVRSITKLPIILKGILREDDARYAVSQGMQGIIISNHGGRQLDTTPSTICVLPKIAAAIDNQLEIFIDGGIRRGTDVLKALALGAKAVFIGRPVIWGLTVEGQTGVYKILELLNQELKLAMILCGCNKIKDISGELLLTSFN